MRRLLIPLCACLLLLLGAATPGAVANEGTCGAATGIATDVTATTATLNGTLGEYPGDAFLCGAWQFDYGTTIAYGTTTPAGMPTMGEAVSVSAPVTGLTPATTYHFRVRANSGDSNVGLDVTFTTLQPPPCGAVTGAAMNVTATTATLNGVLGGLEGSDAASCGAWSFDYGTTQAYGSVTPSGAAGSGASFPVSAPLTGLTPGTTYHFRVHAATGLGNLGDDVTFATLPARRAARSPDDATFLPLAVNSATLRGRLGTLAGSDAGNCGMWFFEYGPTTAYGSTTTPVAAGPGLDVPVSVNATGLIAGVYHYRLRATAGSDNVGQDQVFVAKQGICDRVTMAATSVTTTSATLNALLAPAGRPISQSSSQDASFCGQWQFDCGTTTAYGSSTPLGSAVSGHDVPLSPRCPG